MAKFSTTGNDFENKSKSINEKESSEYRASFFRIGSLNVNG